MSRFTEADALTVHTPIRGLVSIFSGNKKAGPWELPRHMRVLAIFGSAELDLREAIILPGVSVIETLTIFGGIDITVPPSIVIECDGDAIMGAFTLHRSRKRPAALPAPPGAAGPRGAGSGRATAPARWPAGWPRPPGWPSLGGAR